MSLLEIVIFAEVLKHYFRRNKVINNEEKKETRFLCTLFAMVNFGKQRSRNLAIFSALSVTLQ